MTGKQTASDGTSTINKLSIVLFILVGIVLIAVSVALPHDGIGGYGREFLKELGVIVLAVFTVSWIYEKLVAHRHLVEFQKVLNTQLHQLETKSAACDRLGISEIFPTRDVFEAQYPLADFTSKLVPNSEFRIVARSLYLLMNKPKPIKDAIQRGVHVKLCLFSPDAPTADVEKIPDLEISDIQSTISTFRKNFVDWVTRTKLSGSLELRYHQVHLFDSYTTANIGSRSIGIWDLSFGRDTTSKRILVVELNRGLGADLSKRYDAIWKNAVPKFKYGGEVVSLNEL